MAIPPNTTLTGGFLTPQPPLPSNTDNTDITTLMQVIITGCTGLPGNFVRPRWQEVPPKFPNRETNWCAFGLLNSTPDAGPWIDYDPLNDVGPVWRHETHDYMVTFYGPMSRTNCEILRDGMGVPQNTDILRANDMAYVGCGPIRTVPELYNQQWIRRDDMTLTIRRKVIRNYLISYIAIAEIDIVDDTVINIPFAVDGPQGSYSLPVIIPTNPSVQPNNSGLSTLIGSRYDVATFYPGMMGASQVLLRWTAPRIFYIPAGAFSCECTSGAAAAATVILTICVNGPTVGTITIGQGASIGVFNVPLAMVLNIGDTITIIGPATPDITFADVSITLAGSAA